MTETARILFADHDPQITRVLRTALTSQGYEVRAAADAESALRRIPPSGSRTSC